MMYISTSSNSNSYSGQIKLGKRDIIYCFISTFESGSALPAAYFHSHILRKQFGNITEHDLATARVRNFFPFSSVDQDSEKVVKETHLDGCACFLKLELNGGFSYQASALFQGPFQKTIACPCDGHYSCYDQYNDSYLLDFCTRNINIKTPTYASLAVWYHFDSSLYFQDRCVYPFCAGLELERERIEKKKKKKESIIKPQTLYFVFDLEQRSKSISDTRSCSCLKEEEEEEEDTCHYKKKKKKKNVNLCPHKYPPKSLRLPLCSYQRRRHHLFRSFDMRK
jgi:hypothetical protein